MSLEPGLQATITRTVGDDDTAIALGSGDVPVLGTPRLVAWCEAATVEAVRSALDPDSTTVGTNVSIDHLAPTQVGSTVTATATLDSFERRRLVFSVTAHEGTTVIGAGTVNRVVVDRSFGRA